MKEIITIYPAIFSYCTEDRKNYINVEFIDFNCVTFGENLQEAFSMAQDAMGLYLDEMINFPKPTIDFSNIKLKTNQFISYVNINMEEYRKKYNNKAIKKTLSIPCWLNTLAEKENLNFSQILQNALKEKLGID